MRKGLASILVALSLIVALSVNVMAASPSTGIVEPVIDVDMENIILIPVSKPNQEEGVRNSVILPAFTISAYRTQTIGQSGAGSSVYFNTAPYTICTFSIISSSTNISSYYVTIGGVQRSLPLVSRTLLYNGMYELVYQWTHETATPYLLVIANNSSANVTITGIEYVY